MLKNIKVLMKTVLVIVSVLMVACAYSPQQVTVVPTVLMEDEAYGQSKVVDVQVEDQRDSQVIGSRGGAYPDTSVITISNDINASVAKASESVLRQQGFIVQSEMQAVANIKVIIDSLHYEKDKKSLTSKVNLLSVIRLEIVVAEKTFNGRYQTVSTQKSMTTPSNEQNESLINTVLSKTLKQAFTDQKVKVFLNNS